MGRCLKTAGANEQLWRKRWPYCRKPGGDAGIYLIAWTLSKIAYVFLDLLLLLCFVIAFVRKIYQIHKAFRSLRLFFSRDDE
jgi:hypothetical protein